MGVLLSVGLHALAFVALGSFRVDDIIRRDDTVELSVIADIPPPPPPELVVAPAPEPEPEPVKPAPKPIERKAPQAAEKAPPPDAPSTPEPPAAAEETIADFTGTTLTGQGEGGWVSAVGNGGSMNAPIGRPGAKVTGRNVAGVAGGVVGGTGTKLVPEANLSRKPKLPDEGLFNAALERNYPKTARQQGVEGTARIKVRVLNNGKLEPVAKISETYPAFADACMKAVREVNSQGHRADPGLDTAGLPAATEISFRCTFTVE